MPALTADQINRVYTDGNCQRLALFILKNVNSGDTLDVGGGQGFKTVQRAGIASATSATVAAVSNIAGTVLTLPAGLNGDGVWLLVLGVAA